jgi:thiamine-phosphate pyrophosphorylase
MTLRTGKPLVYFISDGSVNDQNYDAKSIDLLRVLSTVVSANIPLVQIREKQLSIRHLFELARRAVSLIQGTQTKLLINDRLDVALAVGADGVHLTSTSLRPNVVRTTTPDGFMIGVSTHSVDEVQWAAKNGVDLAVFGPVFDSPGKDRFVGLDTLREAVRTAQEMPILALGGVDARNYRDVLSTGAAGFAAIRFLNDSQNIETLRAEFNL